MVKVPDATVKCPQPKIAGFVNPNLNTWLFFLAFPGSLDTKNYLMSILSWHKMSYDKENHCFTNDSPKDSVKPRKGSKKENSGLGT